MVQLPTLPRADSADHLGDLLTQQFIRQRGVYRWVMHLCLFWGVVLSCAITFPLTFGWLRFTQAPFGQYQHWFFGFALFSFLPDSLAGILIIHALDWTALLLLVGLVLALHRRFHDLATLAVQRFRFDMVPLGLLLAIVVTGLALTADSLWLGGAYYWFLSLPHEAVVVLWLISLPFGKFFHLIERPATLGVDLYWRAAQNGVFWPCPSEDHPGTPRLYEQRFGFPDGKARFHAIVYVAPAEEPDDDFPFVLTTGRIIYHYLSGNQTRRVPFLREQAPYPWVEVHERAAQRLDIADGAWVTVRTRRGALTAPALVVRTIREDTLFVPYHYGHTQAANILTNPVLEPMLKIPEYKVCAAALAPTPPPPEWAARESRETLAAARALDASRAGRAGAHSYTGTTMQDASQSAQHSRSLNSMPYAEG